MNAGFTVEELKRGVKNPFYERLNKEVLVAIRNEDYKVFLDAAKKKWRESNAGRYHEALFGRLC